MSNSESSSVSIVPRCSCANVLRSKLFSSVPRLRLWYMRRARFVSKDSPGRGTVVGWEVVCLQAMLWVRYAQGCGASTTRGPSASRTTRIDVLWEKRTLGRNARVRETKWCRKIDMVCFTRDSLAPVLVPYKLPHRHIKQPYPSLTLSTMTVDTCN
jgi:hypothetical protein